MKQKTLRAALAAPKIKLLSPFENARIFAQCAIDAASGGADIIVFPELAITGATAGSLFFGELVTASSEEALLDYAKRTEKLSLTSFVGLPIRSSENIYNAVAVVREGKIFGLYLSDNARGVFSCGADFDGKIKIGNSEITASCSFVYEEPRTRAKIAIKTGDSLSTKVDGVDLAVIPYATEEYVGRGEVEIEIGKEMSYYLGCPVIRVGAGEGESGTDGVFAAPRGVYDGERVLYTAPLFDKEIKYVDVEPKRSVESVCYARERNEEVKKSPFIPEDKEKIDAASALAIEIASRGLAERMARSYSTHLVIGVSGGLDSTLALLVAARAVDILGYGRDRIIAVTMPCFGTSSRTKSNALALASELNCTAKTIDIKAAVLQHFNDIGHKEGVYDVVYENSQARERTQVLMDIANAVGGLVVGTGDLSELALGFATYNGDHMSMYCVNGSIPKTFMREIIRYAASVEKNAGRDKLCEVLLDVVNTPISPELLPNDGGESSQYTEEIVGPYELHDFFLYYTVKRGYSPKRILGYAIELFPEHKADDIKKYLDTFLRRFYTQQFKRSCMPDGPRVTEITLSPRGAWHMPSDISPSLWRDNIKDW